MKHRLGEYLFELRERLLAMRSAALGYSQQGRRSRRRPGRLLAGVKKKNPTDQPKRRSLTVGDWLQLVVFVVFVVLFGLPAFLIVVLDALPLVGDWLTGHVPFWDEVTDFYDWLFSHAS